MLDVVSILLTNISFLFSDLCVAKLLQKKVHSIPKRFNLDQVSRLTYFLLDNL